MNVLINETVMLNSNQTENEGEIGFVFEGRSSGGFYTHSAGRPPLMCVCWLY